MNNKYKSETVIRQLFEYFGSKSNKGWFRISIGNVADLNLDSIINTIENSVKKSVSYVNSLAF